MPLHINLRRPFDVGEGPSPPTGTWFLTQLVSKFSLAGETHYFIMTVDVDVLVEHGVLRTGGDAQAIGCNSVKPSPSLRPL